MKILAAFVVTASLAFTQGAAGDLYNKAIKLLDEGKIPQARSALETIIKDYPDSAYVKLAKENLDKPLIGSVEYKNFDQLSPKDIRKRFEQANIRMTAGMPFNEEEIERSRQVLGQMLAKKKIRTGQILETHATVDHKVNVVFTYASK